MWDALHDPEILRKCTPGCRSLKASEPADGGAQTVYDAEMQVGVALVKGTFKGTVTIVDETPLEAYRVAVRASGGIGFSHIDGALRLAHDEGGRQSRTPATLKSGAQSRAWASASLEGSPASRSSGSSPLSSKS